VKNWFLVEAREVSAEDLELDFPPIHSKSNQTFAPFDFCFFFFIFSTFRELFVVVMIDMHIVMIALIAF
jgi:hypothetical protein